MKKITISLTMLVFVTQIYAHNVAEKTMALNLKRTNGTMITVEPDTIFKQGPGEDKLETVTENTAYNLGTMAVADDGWTNITIENYSFEEPMDDKKYQGFDEIPGWTDDSGAENPGGSVVKDYATDGNKVFTISSHANTESGEKAKIYQVLDEKVPSEKTNYRVSMYLQAAYFSQDQQTFHISLLAFKKFVGPKSREVVATTEYTVSKGDSQKKKIDTLTIDAGSKYAGQTLVLQFSLGDDTDTNSYVQGDEIVLEKKAGTLSTKDFNSQAVSIYPNPVVSDDFVTVNGVSNNATVDLFDLSGKEVFSTVLKNKKINVSSLGRGCYIMKINDGDSTVAKKLIID